MVSESQDCAEQLADPAQLRGAAAGIRTLGHEVVAIYLEDAAAVIEGHTEAYGTLVDEKRGLQAKLDRAEMNLRGAHELIGQWRALLVALQDARPLRMLGEEWEVRIARALRGEKP